MAQSDLIAIVAVLVTVLIALIALLFLNSGSGSRKRIQSRIEDLKDLNAEIVTPDAEALFRDISMRRGGLLTAITDWLRPIGGATALRTLVLMGLLSGATGFMIVHKALGLTGPLLVLLPLAMGTGIPYMYLGSLREKRKNEFLDAFPDAIDLVVRAVRAGIPASEALAMAGRELPGPVATEMQQIAEETAIGINPEAAISEAAARVRLPDFSFFAVTLMLQRETGGNLAETLEGLATLLRRRKEMRMKVRALTAEGRFTSKVIAAIPIVIVIALYFLNRDYVILLFTDTVGQIFLGAATALVALGSMILGRMVNLEV